MRKILVLLLLAALGYGGYRYYQAQHPPQTDTGVLTLYGNVDIREVELAFKDTERISAVFVQEGDQVLKGQVLAEQETDRLRKNIEATKAALQAQNFVVQRLKNGSRPEEISEAKAQVEQAEAELVLAERVFVRQTALLASGAAPQQDQDDARAARDVARGTLQVARENLKLLEIGPRWEDISEAEATLRQQEAELALLLVTLEESKLRAPKDAIVRSRNLEPGDMATQQTPVYSLAVVDPKWIRTYVPEADLGRIRPGMRGYATIDAWPERRLAGWVGYISPVAEFTPRSVETPELRTSLVYEVRFNVNDPENNLRLGMPATVIIDTNTEASPPADATPAGGEE